MASSGAVATPAATTAPRRRSSGLMPSFDGLQQLRSSSNGVARRQSMNDQQVKLGFFGQLFHNNFGRNSR